MTETLSAWLKLATAGIAGTALARLLDQLGSAEAIAAAGERTLTELGVTPAARRQLREENSAALGDVERWLADDACSVLTWADPAYPTLLQNIADAPPLLYVRGDPDCLSLPQLAIVGSRNPTRGGAETAHSFAAELARAGLGIASGLAHGIDAAAHTGALAAGGLTVAVMGTGIERIYPARNRDLAHRIAQCGALVSEFPLGTEPQRFNFPRRNRIISGLSLGTLVVEAAERSGSLITARLAGEQGREVFAMPGSIHNPMARGCHRLIRDGARLVETTADIFNELGPLLQTLAPIAAITAENSAANAMPRPQPDAEYAQLLDALGFEPWRLDAIVERSGLTIAEVSSMLLILELDGIVEALPGGRYARL